MDFRNERVSGCCGRDARFTYAHRLRGNGRHSHASGNLAADKDASAHEIKIAGPQTMSTVPPTSPARLPLRGWQLDLARRWNGSTYSLFVLHGNIFDLFPVQDGSSINYVPLKTFLMRRLFPDRSCLLFYDISGGLTFGSPEMQKMFFEWLEIFDNVENTNF